MKAKNGTMTAQMAALAGEVAGLKANDDARDARETCKDDVAVAMQRFAGRPMGDLEKLEEGFVAFHKEHGAKAFAAYTDSLAKTTGVLPDTDDKGGAFQGTAGKAPAVAMKYLDKGTDAVDKAAKFCRDWEELQGSGLSLSQERYVEHRMKQTTAKKVAV